MADATLIVKATRLCNLRCTYCHDWRTGPNQTMAFSVLARTIAAALRDRVHDAVQFVWHGGEPTALPPTFYQKALLVQSRFKRPGQVVLNVLQTNGTRLTPAWCHFLHASGFAVAVSLDGPPELHDRQRRYVSGKPSSADVIRGLELLREHQVPFSVLMVVDEDVLALGPDRVFDYFLSLDVKEYGFLAATPTNMPDAGPDTPVAHYVDPTRMSRFLMSIYDRWRARADPTIRIREIESIRARIRGDGAECCTLAGGCFGHYYMIEPTGEVAHCDLFVGDSRYGLGNVTTAYDFSAFRSGAALRALRSEYGRALMSMRGCPEFRVCNGWCPHEHYLSVRHNPSHQDECCGLRDLIHHIRGAITTSQHPAGVLMKHR